ncbi:hypothetical protein GMRT_11324 [Giardia muris]|uniref:Uncharacterized protein n=1 Tax=Giardia muris TaxID=5742 RepID=A0A4Z1SLU5_GIAMU|nr:hypothetical protein GMRT_11324 [Giardia muris]|eukprot:TNJ26624.1 hypothetical protein GMRT_11324 [Giardia muris]
MPPDAVAAAAVVVVDRAVSTCPEIPSTDALGGWNAAVQVDAPPSRGARRRPRRDAAGSVENLGTGADVDADELLEKLRKLEDCNARLVERLHEREADVERHAALLGGLSGRGGDEGVVLRDAAGHVVFRDADLQDGEECVLHVVRVADVIEYTVADTPERLLRQDPRRPTKNVKLQCGRSFFFFPTSPNPAAQHPRNDAGKPPSAPENKKITPF